jgi:hypothetical protein
MSETPTQAQVNALNRQQASRAYEELLATVTRLERREGYSGDALVAALTWVLRDCVDSCPFEGHRNEIRNVLREMFS